MLFEKKFRTHFCTVPIGQDFFMATRILRYTVLHNRTVLILNHKHTLVIEKRKAKDKNTSELVMALRMRYILFNSILIV